MGKPRENLGKTWGKPGLGMGKNLGKPRDYLESRWMGFRSSKWHDSWIFSVGFVSILSAYESAPTTPMCCLQGIRVWPGGYQDTSAIWVGKMLIQDVFFLLYCVFTKNSDKAMWLWDSPGSYHSSKSWKCIGHQVHLRRKSTLFAMFTGDWNFDNDNTSGSNMEINSQLNEG